MNKNWQNSLSDFLEYPSAIFAMIDTLARRIWSVGRSREKFARLSYSDKPLAQAPFAFCHASISSNLLIASSHSSFALIHNAIR